MNYIRHLTGFFDLVVKDERLNPTHISLYISLFQYWNVNRFRNPISISRSEIMRISKISAKATYHKCMKELHQFGYIRYDPSYNPFRGSLVHLMNFDGEKTNLRKQPKKRTGSGQVLNSRQSGHEQALVPSLNNSNLTNNSNNRGHDQSLNLKSMKKISPLSDRRGVGGEAEKEKLRKKKKLRSQQADEIPTASVGKRKHPPHEGMSRRSRDGGGTMPGVDEVEAFFKSKNYPIMEAKKFFTHYKALGWKLSGNPIEDWQALAEKWMINSSSFTTNKVQNATHNLDTSNNKNYAEPL
jgi:hypothetical protein